MPTHERDDASKRDEVEKKRYPKKQRFQPLSEQLHTRDEGVNPLGGGLRRPAPDEHSAILANSHSERQVVDFTRQLQHTLGNAYVQRLVETMKLQPKLSVSQPDDIYEREADRLAREITRLPGPELRRQDIPEEEELQMQPTQLQRQSAEEEEEEELQAKSTLQRQDIPEEEELQMKAEVNAPSPVPQDIEVRINSLRGNGQSLPEVTRAPLEIGLGHDFSQVHVHTDAEAGELSRRLGAKAFTTESDIFFGENAYQPATAGGQELIAHELTHVVQQQAAPALKPEEETGLARTGRTPGGLQRQYMPEEEEELQAKSMLQRQEIPEEEEVLQAKADEDSRAGRKRQSNNRRRTGSMW